MTAGKSPVHRKQPHHGSRLCTLAGNSVNDAAADGGKKVYIKSYGCQMNVYDSNRMIDALAQDGFRQTDVQEDADLIILNTCHIREKASEKVYSELGRLRNLKNRKKASSQPLQIAVTGCVAQAEGEEIIRRQPAVDLVVGPQNYHRIGNLVRKQSQTGLVDTEFPIDSKFDHLPPPSKASTRSRGVSAFVTVQEGCDKFCTFCVVPYTRGAEVSRPVDSILEEVNSLALADVREITLIGQNVNAYHGSAHADDDKGEGVTLATLIQFVAKVPGIARVRYTTSHPLDMTDDLIVLHATNPKLMPFLHLPVQTGSDSILARMNRKHTSQDYTTLIQRIRKHTPDIALSSDFIVGFPGETNADFDDTMRLVSQVTFTSAYSFKYSPRPGTTGNELGNDVPEHVKSLRLAALQELLDRQRRAFNQASVGKTVPILFEKKGRYSGQLVGKTPQMQTVQVEADNSLIGSIVPVHLTENGSNSLYGKIV